MSECEKEEIVKETARAFYDRLLEKGKHVCDAWGNDTVVSIAAINAVLREFENGEYQKSEMRVGRERRI